MLEGQEPIEGILVAPVIPDAVVFDRGPVLRRALRGLPEPIVIALVNGLEANLDDLIAGRLFKSSKGGGCPVGVALCELFPDVYRPGRLRFWLKHRWQRGVAGNYGLVKTYPRLAHIELAFDTAAGMVRARRPELSRSAVTRALGLWFSAEAQAELDRRRRLDERPASTPKPAPTGGRRSTPSGGSSSATAGGVAAGSGP